MSSKPLKSKDTPVSKKMLDDTRNELKSDIASLRIEMSSRFNKIESQIEKLTAAVYRTNAIVEEQNARNLFVLDGYEQIYRRQEEHDKRLKLVENKP